MKTNPRISIVTITFNSEKTLEETIKSVISQDYDNLEYLIIDGGSKDGTLSIIERYKEKISVVVSEPDEGISDAFNKGIRLATGEIIGIINSDDQLLPGALRIVSSYYSPELDVYRGEYIYHNSHTGYSYPSGAPAMICVPSKYIGMNVCHPSTFVTKRAYNKCGGYKVYLRYIMDIDMLFRLYAANCVFIHIPHNLAIFNTGGTTDDSFYKKVKERYLVIRENGGSFFLGCYVSSLCMVKDIIKRIIDVLFGENFKYKLLRRKGKIAKHN